MRRCIGSASLGERSVIVGGLTHIRVRPDTCQASKSCVGAVVRSCVWPCVMARGVRVFGSVARREARPDSDLYVLVEFERHRGMLERAALRGDLEELLRCPVHVVTRSGLRYARESARERIELEAMRL